MKILHKGNPLTCRDCNCIFEYDKEDVKEKREVIISTRLFKKVDNWDIKYVECPHCGYHAEISAHFVEDEKA